MSSLLYYPLNINANVFSGCAATADKFVHFLLALLHHSSLEKAKKAEVINELSPRNALAPEFSSYGITAHDRAIALL